ncbi:universal stress protein [Thalassococcus sp. CAU 1522]|uniref:Universal stress protein n=1 Tax=Thalassococcus arenae TaxID=2851652 RepID=A0ABS6N5W7_9RHOB|nr:universal stress protein [Thalassococcus arenae]MBV2358935.1 universal stress protein [Thalassococcus arenae]
MTRKIVVGYDDSAGGKSALDFAVKQLKAQGGSLVLAHVLEWSPYSFLTPEEIEERHARRKEELSRAETAVLGPVVAQLAKEGITVETTLKYGHIAETLCRIAKDEKADQIIIGRTGESGFSSRLFGSVAGSLAQVAPVPVTIVP